MNATFSGDKADSEQQKLSSSIIAKIDKVITSSPIINETKVPRLQNEISLQSGFSGRVILNKSLSKDAKNEQLIQPQPIQSNGQHGQTSIWNDVRQEQGKDFVATESAALIRDSIIPSVSPPIDIEQIKKMVFSSSPPPQQQQQPQQPQQQSQKLQPSQNPNPFVALSKSKEASLGRQSLSSAHRKAQFLKPEVYQMLLDELNKEKEYLIKRSSSLDITPNDVVFSICCCSFFLFFVFCFLII